MKRFFLALLATFVMSFAVFAQTNGTTTQTTSTKTTETKKRPPIFRANKDQVMQAQKMLKVAESGKLDAGTRAALKTYQKDNGLKAAGTLNRATLEKMNVTLTDKQKQIPVSPSSLASADDNKTGSGSTKKRGPVFRATKDQIMEAQKMMKEKAMYSGEQTGKLDDATREGLKKFQTANGMKATGTLNRSTLEKMSIELTGKQKEM